MRSLIGGLTLAVAAFLTAASKLPAQQAPEDFRWIDFHSPKDQDVVVWVTRALETDKWTAIREIGVEYDAALVVTALRPTPQSPVDSDTFSVWSVSLTNHSVTALLNGANLRLLDWMLFALGHSRELGALYDDCNQCDASTFFTASYYDVRQHGWAARWMRGQQAVPLTAAHAPSGVTLTQVYAVLADPNGHELIGTWNHFDYGKEKPAEDYVYQFDVDPFSSLDRTAVLSGKEADAMKHRLCQSSGVVPAVARGQDSALCQQPIKPQVHHRAGSARSNQ